MIKRWNIQKDDEKKIFNDTYHSTKKKERRIQKDIKVGVQILLPVQYLSSMCVIHIAYM